MIVDLYSREYSYDKFISDAGALAEGFHTLIENVTIGKSHDNRDIVLMKLGNGAKHILYCAGVHGRENINPIVLMKIIESYAETYEDYQNKKPGTYDRIIYEKCVYELLQTFTFLFVPILNPDGYEISLNGFGAINDDVLREKAVRRGTCHTQWKYNARGIDINRNFPSRLWKPKFKGDYAASENETKALIYVFHHYRSRGFVDIHSRGNSIYYYRHTMHPLYNERQRKIAERLKLITGYGLVPPEEETDTGDSGGNTVHYFSEHFNRPALTIETTPEEADFPLDIRYRHIVYNDLMPVIFELGSLLL